MTEHLDLWDEIDEINKHHKKGFERIEQWYTLPETDREEVTGLTKAPHSILREQAEEYFKEALVARGKSTQIVEGEDFWEFDRFASYQAQYIYLAVGGEILLNAIVLKYDPKFYLEKMDPGRSPDATKLRKRVMQLADDDTSDKQRSRINAILESVRQSGCRHPLVMAVP